MVWGTAIELVSSSDYNIYVPGPLLESNMSVLQVGEAMGGPEMRIREKESILESLKQEQCQKQDLRKFVQDLQDSHSDSLSQLSDVNTRSAQLGGFKSSVV